MSTFYGTLHGQASPVTRTGSMYSGIQVAAQSWKGSVIVGLSYQEHSEDNPLIVQINMSNGSSDYGREVWRGTFEELKSVLENYNYWKDR